MPVKPTRSRSKLKSAEIAALYAQLAHERPGPRTELDYHDPYTLLVAVTLSAQATDVGVNKATKGLFAIADTPQKMVDLGVAGVEGHIKTIGLWRNKAKNVVALSRILLDQYDGTVPEDRDALTLLPGVGRKTANVVMNEAFGHPTIAVDTHIFRVSTRSGGSHLGARHARPLQKRRPPLADPARPLCLHRPQTRLLALWHFGLVSVQGENAASGGLRGGIAPPFPNLKIAFVGKCSELLLFPLVGKRPGDGGSRRKRHCFQ
jgi:endonuclease III